uniref:EGF-like domain-containing protein n=1 Tax=Romanomermis culicivorax TaxID=13658 RepID=A0A915HJF8_ROMCU
MDNLTCLKFEDIGDEAAVEQARRNGPYPRTKFNRVVKTTCPANMPCWYGGITWLKQGHCLDCICPYGLTGYLCSEVITHQNAN